MTEAVQGAARTVRSSGALRALARGGYAADGVVHLLIGAFAVRIAAGGDDAEADQAGALQAIAGAPFGAIVLWLLAALLLALAVYHAVAAVVARGEDAGGIWMRRVSEAGKAVVFAALGVLAGSIALGAHPGAGDSAEQASAGVLAIPGGSILLGIVGAAVTIGGGVFAVRGVMQRFRKRVAVPAGTWGRVVTVLGVAGYVAKGLALAVVGILAIIAAVSGDAEEAGGLDDAVDALLALPYGPFLVGAVGAGLIAYGLFLLLRARYARL